MSHQPLAGLPGSPSSLSHASTILLVCWQELSTLPPSDGPLIPREDSLCHLLWFVRVPQEEIWFNECTRHFQVPNGRSSEPPPVEASVKEMPQPTISNRSSSVTPVQPAVLHVCICEQVDQSSSSTKDVWHLSQGICNIGTLRRGLQKAS